MNTALLCHDNVRSRASICGLLMVDRSSNALLMCFLNVQ